MTRMWLAIAGLVVGCSPGPTIESVETEVGDIGTVVTVSWWSPIESSAQVVYRAGLTWWTIPAGHEPADDGYRYEATLMGLHPESEHPSRLQLVDDEGTVLVEEQIRIETDGLDFRVPSLDLTQANEDFKGFLLTSTIIEPVAAIIISDSGQVVWGTESVNPKTMISEVRMDPAGGAVFVGEFQQDETAGNLDLIRHISLDGRELERFTTPDMHHDFTVLPDGTIAYIAYETIENKELLGDRIVEVTPDGQSVDVWSASETLEYDPTVATHGWEWTHANAIQYQPDEDAYYLSLHNYNSILKIDRSTGEVVWALGGDISDFTLAEGVAFHRQHQFALLDDDRLLIFDNGNTSQASSRVLEVQLDHQNHTAELAWEYRPEPAIYNLNFGDVTRLADGDTLITYSTSGLIEKVSADGQVNWRLSAPLGTAFGYSSYLSHPEAFFLEP